MTFGFRKLAVIISQNTGIILHAYVNKLHSVLIGGTGIMSCGY